MMTREFWVLTQHRSGTVSVIGIDSDQKKMEESFQRLKAAMPHEHYELVRKEIKIDVPVIQRRDKNE